MCMILNDEGKYVEVAFTGEIPDHLKVEEPLRRGNKQKATTPIITVMSRANKMVPHFTVHSCFIRKDNKGRRYGGSDRNCGRKPKYKSHRGMGADRRVIVDGEIGGCIMKMPPENFGIGKAGEMRAKYKRPAIQMTA